MSDRAIFRPYGGVDVSKLLELVRQMARLETPYDAPGDTVVKWTELLCDGEKVESELDAFYSLIRKAREIVGTGGKAEG